MLILRITEKGHYIEIPGMSPFRTPVEANISHVSINLVVSKLQSQGIKTFEIVSDTKGKEAVFTQNDFNVEKNPKKRKQDNYEKRFNKIETLISKLLIKQEGNKSPNQEQINNKLNSIEKLLRNQEISRSVDEKPKGKAKKNKTPVIEELTNTFIPEINLDGMELKGNDTRKSIKQDKQDIDDSADLLSRIMGSED